MVGRVETCVRVVGGVVVPKGGVLEGVGVIGGVVLGVGGRVCKVD